MRKERSVPPIASWARDSPFIAWWDRLWQLKWYVHVGIALASAQFTTYYIGRYAKRPPMAQSRIKDYDGEWVTFEYEDKRTKEHVLTRLLAEAFLALLIRHIPDKHFRQIRYGGIYSTRTRKRDLAVARACLRLEQGKSPIPLGWRERRCRENSLDPLICPRCGAALTLVKVAYRSRDGPLKERTFDN